MIPKLHEVLELMNRHNVRCIVIGGWAAILHGTARSTNDVDLVYARDDENVQKLVKALAEWHPYLRGVPPGLPFRWDAPTVRSGLNFTLTTDRGSIDVLGEVAGGGTYEELLPYTQEKVVQQQTCVVVTLERLIQLKRAAGRPRDLIDLSELQAILEERKAHERPRGTEPKGE